MLEHCLELLFLSTVTGGIFILAALVLRSCLKHVLPKSFLVKLWSAVLLNFLLFTQLPSPASVYNFFRFDAPVFRAVPNIVRGVSANAPASAGGLGNVPSGAPVAAQSWAAVDWHALLFLVWLSGSCVLLAYFLISYIRTVGVFRAAVPANDMPPIRRWLEKRKARRIGVYLSDMISSPVSFGLFRPVIVLPASLDMGDPALLHGVLEHEFIHSRHMHNLLKILSSLVVVVHWFNPLAWVYLFLFSHDAELACDENVVRSIGREKRADYARSLLSIAGPSIESPRLMSLFSAKNVKERVINIMAYENPGSRMRILELLIVVAAFAFFGTVATGGRADDGGARFSGRQSVDGIRALLAGGVGETALAISGGGRVIKAEIETGDQGALYEFVILSDGREHKIHIDGDSLQPSAYESRPAKEHYRDLEAIDLLSAEQATAIALKALGGGEVTGFSLEYDVKSLSFNYEVEIVLNDEEYDVEMDAQTGYVKKISIDI